jgi:NAD(P)-dependent dehydrogenase (short-subunit alcohol dehydrogenase family)
MRFSGKVAFITGAARGMGACAALEFAKKGADIVAVSRGRKDPVTRTLSNDDLDGVVNEIKTMGRRAIGVIADISKSVDVKNAVSKAIAEFGKIDILVNNAGVIFNSPIIYSSEEDINNVIDVNLKGCIFCCKYVVPHMARQNYGKIINISSGAGLYAEPNYTAYSASKYGIIGLTESLAAEVSHYNINVNAVCPGAVLEGRRTLRYYFGVY